MLKQGSFFIQVICILMSSISYAASDINTQSDIN